METCYAHLDYQASDNETSSTAQSKRRWMAIWHTQKPISDAWKNQQAVESGIEDTLVPIVIQSMDENGCEGKVRHCSHHRRD